MFSWFGFVLLSSINFSTEVQQVSVVSKCFQLFSFFCLSWLSYVSVLHVFGCFDVVFGSVGVVLRLP